jgi:hypothetical protein
MKLDALAAAEPLISEVAKNPRRFSVRGGNRLSNSGLGLFMAGLL